jgi:hypothetical protein
VSPATLRLTKLLGFRYDENRDGYVLRLVGNRFGPVLRNRPPVDSAAAQMEWSESMDALAARRRNSAGRFARDPHRASRAERDVINR